jgi:4-amino-4-deoxy-L-arabinose transferase-like glycosyltransferase
MMPEPQDSGRETALIWVATALGGVVRCWSPDRLGLTHFDEGMYAMAALWVTLPGGLTEIDPAASLYAPPGYVTLVGLAYVVGGVIALAPILVSIVFGVATIRLAGSVARRTFGPGAGVAAAALAAANGQHVAFSRMALTDSMFLFFWLLAMELGGRFLERPGWMRAVAFGLSVGLAQNVKYNGGLAGLLVAATAILGLVRDRGRRDSPRPFLVARGLLVAGLVAVALYLPWAFYVEKHVGYAQLAAHHRSYTGGLGAWPSRLTTQLAQVVALSGGSHWGFTGWSAAMIGARLVRGSPGGRGLRSWGVGVAVILLSALLFAVLPELPWWLGLAWVPWLLRDDRPTHRLLGVWWLALSVITPFYHPYARLWLPLTGAGWLLSAGAIVWLTRRAESPDAWREAIAALSRANGWRSQWRAQEGVIYVAGCAALGLWLSLGPGPRPVPLPGLLQPTDSFRRHVAGLIPDPAAAGVESILALCRPHGHLYLVLQGRVPFRKMQGLDQLLADAQPGRWALVDEVLLRQGNNLDEAMRRLQQRYEPVPGAGWEETLSPPTLLDVDPSAAYGDTSARRSHWWLLRPRPAENLP